MISHDIYRCQESKILIMDSPQIAKNMIEY